MLRRVVLPALFLVVCTSLQADVTMRMGLDFKINMVLPTAVPKLPFNEMVTRVKGDHGYAVVGPIVVITDISSGKISLLDPKAQQYATVAMADYMSKLAGVNGQSQQNMPEEAKQMLAKIKFDTESHDTGRTERIQGIEAYEREVVVNMSIPVPMPGQENGLQITMKLQIWKPQPAEFERVPALRELVAYNDRNKGFGDLATVMRQVFSAMPGMGDNAGKMVAEITKGGNVTLGMHMGIFMPGLAKMMEQAQAKAQANGGAASAFPALPAADTPLAEVNFDLKELSTGTVPDDLFVIPAGYKEAPLADMLKGMTDAFTGAKPQAAPAPLPK